MLQHEVIIYTLATLTVVLGLASLFNSNKYLKWTAALAQYGWVSYITYLFIDYTHAVNSMFQFLILRMFTH